MSRKYDRQMKINEGIAAVLEDPMTMVYLTRKIIRKKPKYLPWFAWKLVMWFVLAPDAKKPINPNNA